MRGLYVGWRKRIAFAAHGASIIVRRIPWTCQTAGMDPQPRKRVHSRDPVLETLGYQRTERRLLLGGRRSQNALPVEIPFRYLERLRGIGNHQAGRLNPKGDGTSQSGKCRPIATHDVLSRPHGLESAGNGGRVHPELVGEQSVGGESIDARSRAYRVPVRTDEIGSQIFDGDDYGSRRAGENILGNTGLHGGSIFAKRLG